MNRMEKGNSLTENGTSVRRCVVIPFGWERVYGRRGGQRGEGDGPHFALTIFSRGAKSR